MPVYNLGPTGIGRFTKGNKNKTPGRLPGDFIYLTYT